MKIGGIDPKTLPCEEVLVLPRGDQQIVLRACGLDTFDDFNRRCPEPVAPRKLTKDGPADDTDDKGYQADLDAYQKRRLAYVVVASLQQIEWDTVKLDEPATWQNWEKDLRAAGLKQVECNRVLALVMEANSLDEKKLQAARDSFFHGQRKESGG